MSRPESCERFEVGTDATLTVVLRTSPAGHPYCAEAAAPLDERGLADAWARVRSAAPGSGSSKEAAKVASCEAAAAAVRASAQATLEKCVSYEATILGKYHWMLLPQVNEIARAALGGAAPDGGGDDALVVVDAAELTRLRADSHKPGDADCLHHARPGVMDWWAALLLGALETAWDIS